MHSAENGPHVRRIDGPERKRSCKCQLFAQAGLAGHTASCTLRDFLRAPQIAFPPLNPPSGENHVDPRLRTEKKD
jgi:hypothetical protein